jgi:FkbM family methyltransferase
MNNVTQAIKPFSRTSEKLHVQILKALFAHHGIGFAFDVGANAGQTYDFLREKIGFRGHVTSFEPNPEAFAILRERTKPGAKWQTIRVALGPSEGTQVLNLTKNSKFSSFLDPHKVMNGAGHTRKSRSSVSVHRVDRYVADAVSKKAPGRLFLKIDTQGYDLEVLKGLGDKFLPLVPIVQLELTMKNAFYAKAPKMTDSIAYMARRGYSLAAAINTISDQNYRALEFDGIFVR